MGSNDIKISDRRKKRSEDMLNKFAPLFSKYGMDKPTIKMLAAAEGRNETILYRFFKDKDDIIAKCTAYHHAKIQTELVQLFCENVKDLDKMCEDTIAYVDTYMDTCRFLVQVLAHPQYATCADETTKLVNDLLDQFASKLKDTYIIGKSNSIGIAMGINSFVNNYILRPDKEAFRLQFYALCESLKKRI